MHELAPFNARGQSRYNSFLDALRSPVCYYVALHAYVLFMSVHIPKPHTATSFNRLCPCLTHTLDGPICTVLHTQVGRREQKRDILLLKKRKHIVVNAQIIFYYDLLPLCCTAIDEFRSSYFTSKKENEIDLFTSEHI
uniref:Uncharacterized protein n=1 Tax=Palpitomonas bilix TaxID=652834 RepID=A0A7S3GKZ3_9EUKA